MKESDLDNVPPLVRARFWLRQLQSDRYFRVVALVLEAVIDHLEESKP